MPEVALKAYEQSGDPLQGACLNVRTQVLLDQTTPRVTRTCAARLSFCSRYRQSLRARRRLRRACRSKPRDPDFHRDDGSFCFSSRGFRLVIPSEGPRHPDESRDLLTL